MMYDNFEEFAVNIPSDCISNDFDSHSGISYDSDESFDVNGCNLVCD